MSGNGTGRNDPDRQGGYAEFEQKAQNITEDVSDGIRSTADEATGRARHVARQAAGYAKCGADETSQYASRAEASVVEMIRERPFGALLVAGAIGLVVGMLIADRRA